MTIDHGRSASPSGHSQAEPEEVSALRASVPNALSDGTVLMLAEEARQAICAQPAGFLVDPGAGSAMDKFQRNEPCMTRCADMARRGGSYETLYTGTSVEKMILHVVRAASVIEARRAETENTGAVHESAVLAEQTPNTGRGTSHG